MKIIVTLLTAIILATNCANIIAQNEAPIKKKVIRYTETIRPGRPTFQNQGMPAKVERVSNMAGNIILVYESAVPDSVKIALEAAKKMWEAKIPISIPVFIKVNFTSLGEETAMLADATCLAESELAGCPCPLAAQIKKKVQGDMESPDGYLSFNSDINWTCSFSNDASSEYNLTTMALRGLARCLGFGPSVCLGEADNDFFFAAEVPSYYDCLLFDDNYSLANLTPGSQELAEFVISKKVRIRTKDQEYSIYSPDVFDPYISLSYFKEGNSLMSYSLAQGSVKLAIDEQTTDVLRAIGWDIISPGLKIYCTDISDNGIGSSYIPHTFFLQDNSGNITDYNWTFQIKDKAENYVQVFADESKTFTIPKIAYPDNYFININGDLEGRILCDYVLNGEPQSAQPFALSLELKPIINSIDDITSCNNGPFEFSLNFNVKYKGADYLYVLVQEEYDSTLRSFRFDEPFIAHVNTGNISNLYYSWITVQVVNKYGSVSETMEYEPAYDSYGNSLNGIAAQCDQNGMTKSNNVESIQIYNMNGFPVFEGMITEYKNINLCPGIYLKKTTYENNNTKIEKLLVK